MKRILYLLIAVLIVAVAGVQAGLPPGKGKVHPSVAGTANLDVTAMYDANNLNMVVTNIGSFAYDDGGFYGKNDGLYFPARDPSKTDNTSVVYAGGIWIGAMVENEIRVAVAEYSQDFVPGKMINGSPAPDNESYHVYKIVRGDTTSSDYLNWPVADGAPVDATGRPLLIGDQTLWCVYNDADPSSHNSGATKPLGLEVQQTVFGFARTGPLGNCLFIKFKIINKGSNTLNDAYVSCWSDPDLGGAADDLVGCDVDLSLGYCYNSTNADNSYKSNPPAVGYDFFQGPIVPSEGDTAFVSGRAVPNFRNLPMTSFNKYINGTDPDSPQEIYNYMMGLQPDGTDLVDPVTGQVTKFFVSGDPVANTGWLDDTPADRRFMQSAGPFTMAPGDTQEVVMGIIVGQGSDRLTSITALKFYDDFAQTAFNLNFDLPTPPAVPVLQSQVLNGQVVLEWGNVSELTPGDFPFQGYNVWQSADGSHWKLIATYDVADGAAIIFDNVFDVETGVVINRPVQFGSDIGVRRYYVANEDKILGGPLRNLTDYFYAVTAYSYDASATPKTLENPQSATKTMLTPQRPVANTDYGSLPFDTLPVTHTSSGTSMSDGNTVAFVVDPAAVTGHRYHVQFRPDENLGMVWDLIDDNLGTPVLRDQTNQSGDNTYTIVDGLMVKVMGPPLAVNGVKEIATAQGPITPDNVHMSRNSTSDWYMDPFGDQTLSRYAWRGATNHDFEIRFTESATEYCWDFYGPDNSQDYPTVFRDASGNLAKVPLEIWDVTDNRRITFMNLDDDASGSFTWGDGLYLIDMNYDDVAWETPGTNADQYQYTLHLGRFRFMDLSGNLTRPAPGTIVHIYTNKTNTPVDTFSFVTPVSIVNSDSLAGRRLDRIKAVPNPFYNNSGFDVGQNDHRIRIQILSG
ncbi:MAG: hypothetical protein HZB43_11150 [candidate division Zixibacteria bacterium]|nr:hypothetical protein [candidate division Zixibacteria bacterium]